MTAQQQTLIKCWNRVFRTVRPTQMSSWSGKRRLDGASRPTRRSARPLLKRSLLFVFSFSTHQLPLLLRPGGGWPVTPGSWSNVTSLKQPARRWTVIVTAAGSAISWISLNYNKKYPDKGQGYDISNILRLHSDALLWKFENVLVFGFNWSTLLLIILRYKKTFVLFPNDSGKVHSSSSVKHSDLKKRKTTLHLCFHLSGQSQLLPKETIEK